MNNFQKSDTATQEPTLSDFNIPAVVFGTSGLGNLFVPTDYETKLNIVKECIHQSNGTAVFDSAGKYGAGLALETLGKCLKELNVKQEKVIISNKLGWIRTELKTKEPTFEPGVWKDLKYDAVQKISYDGIMECYKQGNELLNGYIPQMLSVHDPDEYLASAKNSTHFIELYNDILDAYEALFDLRKEGKVKAIGVGAKDWKIIQKIITDVPLDWVMIANSMTIKNHPPDLLDFMHQLEDRGIVIINSAVFHSGFLVGGSFFDYKLVDPTIHRTLFKWREDFFKICKEFDVKPAEACVKFAMNIPGVVSIALNTSEPKHVEENVALVQKKIQDEFWQQMKAKGLIRQGYPYV